MRIAVTTHASSTHLLPVVLPTARLAGQAGHEVAVATGPSMTEHIERAGLIALPVPSMLSIGELMRGLRQAPRRPAPPPGQAGGSRPDAFAHPFAAAMTSRHTADLVDGLGTWKPDFVLHDSTELGGYLAAECLGVAHGVLDIAPMTPFGHPTMLDQLNQLRTEFDLPTVDDVWHPFRAFRAGVVPEVFYPERNRLPGARYYRPSAIEEAGEPPLDPDIAALPADRPLVLASLGANAPQFERGALTLLHTIVEALGELPVTGVVAIGADRTPDEWDGARPANVHLRSFVQQRTLLRACDLFVTHAGFNGAREAFAAGVPMVALPLFGDHPGNAARLAELGVAVRLDAATATRSELRAAVEQVLGDPTFRGRARWVQRQVLALPPLDQLVQDVLALAS